MSKVDELKRLFRLRASGALSEDQYRKKLAALTSNKGEKRKNSRGSPFWGWVIVAALLATWIATGFMTRPDHEEAPTSVDTYYTGKSFPTSSGVAL
ncbi:SHOCT domain-containing protein [Burkholderia metallica]|uniref:SHOCT domain-containing protein n=1 Tax=Burkholderia metallica TaxID=488729 RepID=A0ABT8PF04_9BURK|nr:SHOCT domain-containing protein [Burkholderia metallica]MDN7933627.1 SHOCT domain-containing protein [Burkholderia metallica]